MKDDEFINESDSFIKLARLKSEALELAVYMKKNINKMSLEEKVTGLAKLRLKNKDIDILEKESK